MKNQEIFILILLVSLVILRLFKKHENFSENFSENNTKNYKLNSENQLISPNSINNFPCENFPFNSNCTCPSDQYSQKIIGQFPMNYGQTAPYAYTCIKKDEYTEPSVNLWQNLSD